MGTTWYVCDTEETPCVYAPDAVLALRRDPPLCLAHRALLLSWRRHDGMSREAVLAEVKDNHRPVFSPGQFEIGAWLRDRRRR